MQIGPGKENLQKLKKRISHHHAKFCNFVQNGPRAFSPIATIHSEILYDCVKMLVLVQNDRIS